MLEGREYQNGDSPWLYRAQRGSVGAVLSRSLTTDWLSSSSEATLIKPIPCPFCNGKKFATAFGAKGEAVMCSRKNCQAVGPERKNRVTAIRAWNRGEKYEKQYLSAVDQRRQFRNGLRERNAKIEKLKDLIRESAPLRWAVSTTREIEAEAAAWEKKAYEAVR